MLKQVLQQMLDERILSDISEEMYTDSYLGNIGYYTSTRMRNNTPWAKTFFIDCSLLFPKPDDLFDLRKCLEFQSNLLGKEFFFETTTLRWNYYLYFIYEGRSCPNGVDKEAIENNTQYVRKRIVSVHELKGLLKLIEYRRQKNDMPDPEQDWKQLLASKGLTACLTNGQYTETVRQYIETEWDSSPSASIVQRVNYQSNKTLEVPFINELLTQNYRPAVFGQSLSLPLKAFNLIVGTNGTGKSSLIDAIEFALTGSIKRLLDSGGNSDEGYASVVATTSIGSTKTYKSDDKAEIKDREQAWYNVPKTRQNSKIGSKFEQMNRFSIESVFSLIQSQCRNKDEELQDSITKLCFGEELTLMQKHWRSYMEKFLSELKRYHTECQESEKKKGVIEKKLAELQRDIHARQTDTKLLYELLFGAKPESGDYQRFEDIALRFEQKILLLNSIDNPITLAQMLHQLKSQKALVLEYEEKHQQFKTSQNLYQRKLLEMESLKSNILQQEENSQSYLSLSEKIKRCKLHMSSIGVSEDQLHEKINHTAMQVERISKLLTDYHQFWNEFSAHESMKKTQIEERIKVVESEVAKYKSHIVEFTIHRTSIRQEIETVSYNINRIQELQTELLQRGKSIVIESQQTTCPLCGQSYGDVNILLSRIQELTQQCTNPMQGRLSLLSDKKNEIEGQIEQLNAKLRNCANEALFLTKYLEIYKFCSDISLPRNTIYIRDIHDSIILANEEASTHYEDLKELLTEIRTLRAEFLSQGTSQSSLKDYLEICNAKMSSISEQIQTSTSKQASLQLEIDALSQAISMQLEIEEEFNMELEKKQWIEDVLLAISDMQDAGLFIVPETDLLSLKNNLSKLEGAIAVITKNNEVLQLKKEIKRREEEILKTQRYIVRCNTAVDALKELKPLSHYSKAFIHDNLQQISDIFKKLHLPPEFSEIKSVDGEIVIIRKGSEDYVHMYQMSMGQRISLALAIMFQMHTMGKSAPRILLLDEPISNLDDLHIMNLIEILRELTINGVQLFITTSNQEVANYLVRKFAFLKDEMAYYILNREVVGDSVFQTKIIQQQVPYLIASGE